MKKAIIIVIAVIALMTSCKSGCGCPGGAGYSQTTTQDTHQHA